MSSHSADWRCETEASWRTGESVNRGNRSAYWLMAKDDNVTLTLARAVSGLHARSSVRHYLPSAPELPRWNDRRCADGYCGYSSHIGRRLRPAASSDSSALALSKRIARLSHYGDKVVRFTGKATGRKRARIVNNVKDVCV